MRIIDTIVSREGDNSAWANVVFLGDGGEAVSVRLAYPVPSGGSVGHSRILQRAKAVLRDMMSDESFETLGERVWSMRSGRFGVTPEEMPGTRSYEGHED